MANVRIIREVTNGVSKEWRLCFQWCEYIFEEEDYVEYGYRFIWRRPDGTLQAARGQARIHRLKDMHQLLALAANEGWLGIENQ